MGGHAELNDFSSSMADHEPGLQQVEPNGGDDEKIHRGDTVAVVAKKRLPSLALIVIGILLWEISGDGGEAHGEAQLFEFGLDHSGTPPVLIRESTNQGLNLR